MNDARQFGAVGDGRTLDTKALQNAIDAGGMVRLTPGVYLTGTLYLKSNGGLYIEPGATILGSPNLEDYNAPDFCPQNWASKVEITNGGHLITAVNQENVTIEGGGCIDGNCHAFLNQIDEHMKVWFKRAMRPAQMIHLCECVNVKIQNLKLQNSPYWHCFLHGCSYANIHGLNITGDHRVPNNDGIDLDCCQFVTVDSCNVNVGDDAITVRCDETKLLNKQPAQNIAVTNCNLHSDYANAMRVGVGEGTVHNCTFSNINVHHTRTAVSVVSKYSDRADIQGGTLTDVSFNGLQIDCRRLCNIKLDNSPNMVNKSHDIIRNIRFANIAGQTTLTSFVQGNNVGTIQGISFTNLNLHYEGKGPQPNVDEEGHWGNDSTDAAFKIASAKDVVFQDTAITFNDSPGWKHAVTAENAQNVHVMPTCNLTKPVDIN